MPNLHETAEYIVYFLQRWSAAISDPRHFLAPLFHPSDAQTIDALEFYLATLTFAFALQVPFVLGQKGELGEKARLAASSVVGLVSSAVIAMTWHLSFSLLGGGASFAGTCLAYVYAGAPYIPLISLASLITFAGLPSDLQHFALLPATAEAAMRRSWTDPRTKKGLVGLGSLGFICVMVWSAIVQLRSMSFVHRLTGWRLFWCIVISLVMAAIVTPLLKAIASVFNQPVEIASVDVAPNTATPATDQNPLLISPNVLN